MELSILLVNSRWFLYIDPLKQGLKLSQVFNPIRCGRVFIHRSIKTRIETARDTISHRSMVAFLYIDPIKQGLKHISFANEVIFNVKFLYIDPIKQGLKLINCHTYPRQYTQFLYIDPIKQGLKRKTC